MAVFFIDVKRCSEKSALLVLNKKKQSKKLFTVLESHLRSANASLQTSVNEWNTLIGRLDVVTTQAEALDPATIGTSARSHLFLFFYFFAIIPFVIVIVFALCTGYLCYIISFIFLLIIVCNFRQYLTFSLLSLFF